MADHEHAGRPYASDAYVEAKRRELLDRLVATLRDAAPLHQWFWDEEAYEDRDKSNDAPPRSMMLLVAQFWNDNADDECHLQLIASQHATPFWPHACTGGSDCCRACSNVGYINWGYTETIPALEGLAGESDGERALNTTFRPWAIARRRDDGGIDVELVNPPMRGWLDLAQARAPVRELPAKALPLLAGDRAVLGDALLEAGDPRGELIAGRDGAQLAEHGRSWLGSVEPYVPRSGVRYRDGVPDEIFVCYDGKAPLADGVLPWRLAPRIRTLAQCVDFWVPEMRHVRELGVVDEELLDRIEEPTAIERLEVLVHADAFVLPRANFPMLHTLVLHGAGHGVGVPRDLNVEVVALRCEDEAAHVAWLRAWVERGAPVIASMHDHDTWSARGWTVDLGGPTIVVSHRGFHPYADDRRRIALRAAFGTRPYREVASATWNGLS